MLGIVNITSNISSVLLLDDIYVNLNGIFFDGSGSHTTSANMYGSYGGFQFNGRNTSGSNWWGINWSQTLNFDYYNYLFFRYLGHIHGNVAVKIVNPAGTTITSFSKSYSTYALDTWQTNLTDISNIKGTNTIYFGGGYSDSSGNTSSYTRYAEVLLYNHPDNLVGKYTI